MKLFERKKNTHFYILIFECNGKIIIIKKTKTKRNKRTSTKFERR